MSESPYYTQYSTIKEDKEILLAQAGEHISKINAIANRVVSAYIEGCRAKGLLPAKYLVKLESDIEQVSLKLINTINHLDKEFERSLYHYRKTVGALLELSEPKINHQNTEGYRLTKLSEPDSDYNDLLYTTYARSASVKEADATTKAMEDLIPMFFPTSRFAKTFKANLQCQ